MTIHLPSLPVLRPLVELCGWVSLIGQGLRVLQLDRAAIERAAQRRLTPIHIAEMLRQLTSKGLAPEVYQHLERLYAQCGQLCVEQLAVIRASNPETLRDLYQDRTLRETLDKPLSPHYSTIKAGRLSDLLCALERRALIPARESAVWMDETTTNTGAFSWLAMRVYQELSALFPQSIPLPGVVSDEIKFALSPAQQQDLECAAQTFIEGIRRALHGDIAAFAPSPVSAHDSMTIRTAIERSYQKQQPLTIDYFSPAIGILTRRTITPILPIRWNGEIGYVEAFCQLEDAARTFRLDRILGIISTG